ncbi:hypothetical protein ACFQ7B_14910 [Streptomyces erythrochromogenes]|uniref:hypothetical protein n=1 Tax=Streptomyces erythrochromogenes TaxID=285574 RepID=UPI00367D39BB
MEIWTDLGFTQSPYSTDSLPPTAIGERLLVGRESHTRRLINRLSSSSSHVTIEGDAGVGKTSLMTVASYRMKRNSDKSRLPIMLPVDERFQIAANGGTSLLEAKVYRAIAAAFIQYHDDLKSWGYRTPKVKEIDKWMNSPLMTSISGGINVAGLGFSGGRGESSNSAFAESGLANTVHAWIKECFDPPGCGYFVCVLDNLELLVSSDAARQVLEEIRDTILAEPGLRWIICGARGVVRTAVASPRLQGRLCRPIKVEPLSKDDAIRALEARIEEFSLGGSPPVGPVGFQYLYEVLRCNLRDTLQACEDFSFWLHDEGIIGGGERDHLELLQSWLAQVSDEYSTREGVSAASWRLLDDMAENGGACQFDDFDLFGFGDRGEMRRRAKELEENNLTQISPDDAGTFMVSSGWLARFSRAGYGILRA